MPTHMNRNFKAIIDNTNSIYVDTQGTQVFRYINTLLDLEARIPHPNQWTPWEKAPKQQYLKAPHKYKLDKHDNLYSSQKIYFIIYLETAVGDC